MVRTSAGDQAYAGSLGRYMLGSVAADEQLESDARQMSWRLMDRWNHWAGGKETAAKKCR